MNTSKEKEPLFKLKQGIIEKLSISGQGTITLGSITPSGPKAVKLTPEEPYVRGAEYARYHSELNHVVEDGIDIKDFIDDDKNISALNSIRLDDDGGIDSIDNGEEVEVENEFAANQDNEDEPDTEDNVESKSSFSDIESQFSAVNTSNDSVENYDYPDEDEPEEPVKEEVGVSKLPSESEIDNMQKQELKDVAQSVGVFDDVPPNENGHVTKKNIKKHLLGLIEDS